VADEIFCLISVSQKSIDEKQKIDLGLNYRIFLAGINKFFCSRFASKLTVASFNRTLIEWKIFRETNSYVSHYLTSKHQRKARQFGSQTNQINKHLF